MRMHGPHPVGQGSDPDDHAPLGHRLQVRVHRRRLDEELASGAAIGDSPERTLRAEQLADQRARRRLAAALRRIVCEAQDPRITLRVLVAPARTAVLQWSEALLGLAERIERPGPLAARGLAQAVLLISDGAGPLYYPGATHPLGEAIWSIAEGLTPCERHRVPASRRRTDRSAGFTRCCPVCGAVDAAFPRTRAGRRRR